MTDPLTYLKKQSAHYHRKIGQNKLSSTLDEIIAQLDGHPIDGFRLLSVNALINLLEHLERDHSDSDAWFAAERVASLCAIPAERIEEYDRMRYIERTSAGEDIYAYWKPGDDGGVWNLYDIDTRIALCILPATWRIEQETAIDAHSWLLCLRHDEQRVIVRVNVAPSFDTAIDYERYRRRRIADLLGHLNTFDVTPEPGDVYNR